MSWITPIKNTFIKFVIKGQTSSGGGIDEDTLNTKLAQFYVSTETKILDKVNKLLASYALTSSVEELNEKVTTNTNDIATNTSNIASLTEKVTTNTNNISSLTTTVNTNTTNITTNTNSITSINDKLAKLENTGSKLSLLVGSSQVSNLVAPIELGSVLNVNITSIDYNGTIIKLDDINKYIINREVYAWINLGDNGWTNITNLSLIPMNIGDLHDNHLGETLHTTGFNILCIPYPTNTYETPTSNTILNLDIRYILSDTIENILGATPALMSNEEATNSLNVTSWKNIGGDNS